MPELFRRIGDDLRHLRNVDAYAIAILVIVFAVLSVVGDILSDDVRWGVLFAGIGVLVFRVTLPERGQGSFDDLLGNRSAFTAPFSDTIGAAGQIWVFAPSAVNLISQQHCELMRKHVLNKPDGLVRIVVLDPADKHTLDLASRHLDDSTESSTPAFHSSLDATIRRLESMAQRTFTGTFEYGLLDFNPGFSLVAIDPGTTHGTVLVEFHAFHNQSSYDRMHIELTRATGTYWYEYWQDQFEQIWQRARKPARAVGSRRPD